MHPGFVLAPEPSSAPVAVDADATTTSSAGPAPVLPSTEGSKRERVVSMRRQQGDRLYRKYGPAVYGRCLRILRNRDEAKDATQEVFIKLLRHVERLEDPETALPWIYRVAMNHCLNVARDARWLEPLQAPHHVRELVPGVSYPDVHLARAIIARCDAQTRAIAIGVLVEGMDHEELAEILGVSTRTISRKLRRFLLHARKFAERSEPSAHE